MPPCCCHHAATAAASGRRAVGFGRFRPWPVQDAPSLRSAPRRDPDLPCPASPSLRSLFAAMLSSGWLAATALCVLLALPADAAPASTSTTAAPAPALAPQPEITPLQPGEEFYDQRQNGSENYRIHMDGMVVVVAPPEALMSVAGAAGAGQGGQLEQQLLDIVAQQQAANAEDLDVKPGKPGAKPPQACQEGTPGCKKKRPLPAKSRSQLRLASLLLPLLRRQPMQQP